MPETSKISKTLDEAWEAVFEESTENVGHFFKRVFGESLHSIFVGYHQPGGRLDLGFEVASSAIRKISLQQVAKGFQVEVGKPAGIKKPGTARVSVILNRESFSDLFKVLAVDLVEHCLSGKTDSDAMAKVHGRLEHWRKFSEKTPDEGLSVSQQIGLYGELYLLRQLMQDGLDETRAVEAWHGPLRDNQDFCFGPIAIEVKASASNNANEILISNIRQLDNTGLDGLYLYHVSLDRRRGAGESLPAIVDDHRAQMKKSGSASADLFEDLLIDQGYHSAQSYLYESEGYTVRSKQLYAVKEGFPRIIESELAAGVVEANYKISLSSTESFKDNLGDVVRSELMP